LPLAVLTLLTAAAAGLRFYHLDCGLPGTVYVDAFKFVDEAARMAATGDFAPRLYQYPGLYTYLLAILDMFTAAGPYARHLLALAVAAVAGVALVPATYFLARRMSGAVGGLLAAALVAACPILVTQSRIPAPDILATLFVTVALYHLLGDPPSRRSLIAAGVAGGLAVGSKFTGGFLMAWFALAGWLLSAKGARLEWLRRVTTVALVAVPTFLVTTPWLLPRLGTYVSRFRLELVAQRYGQIGRIQLGYLDYLACRTPNWEQPWLGSSILDSLGILVTVMGLAALAWGISGRGGRRIGFVAGYVIVYVALISAPGHMRAVRFLLPVLPAFYASMGWWLDAIVLPRLPRWRIPIAAAIAVLVVGFPAIRSVRYAAASRQPLTNELAEEWVTRTIPPGTRVFIGPFFTENLERLPLEVGHLNDPGLRQYRLPEDIGPNPERDPLYYPAFVDQLRAGGARYVILNSYFDGGLSPVPENRRYFPRSVAAHEAFMKRLSSEARLVYSVAGWAEGRLGPDIAIYRFD
jgi:4-amino-4-deoxy-L-arabinose transferase-like glycosyltransferase